jgi:lysophospholipase L1-like esterase
MAKSIEELDPNFQVDDVSQDEEAGSRWVDARELTLEGLGWPDESQPYTRLPDRAQGVVRDDVWHLSRHSAGICVRFTSNAPQIAARWSLLNQELAMSHMPATGVSGLDLYARDETGGWRWAGVGVPSEVENEVNLLSDATPQEREYSVYLPLYNGTTKLEIGVPQGSTLQPAPARSNTKTVGFYGTSIVHGGCASRTGMAYPAIAGRALDCATINLGFSGNGRSEPEVAALLAELDVDVWVLDPLPNMDPSQVHERFANFVQTIRTAHPQTPIVVVENITYQNDWLHAESRSESKNVALREVYGALVAGGMEYLHYVEGAAFLGEDGEGTVDGVHPTDVGFMRQAKTLEPILRPLLHS